MKYLNLVSLVFARIFCLQKIKYVKALENVKMGKAPSIQLKGHNKGH